MPALQSPWFVPHVVVYLFPMRHLEFRVLSPSRNCSNLPKTDCNWPIIWFISEHPLLTLGLLFGALWAKEAWGHYWTWDPKETWAFLTWTGYILYIHYRFYHPREDKKAMYLLASAFMVLLICWFGVNYLPTAQNSVHTYTNP